MNQKTLALSVKRKDRVVAVVAEVVAVAACELTMRLRSISGISTALLDLLLDDNSPFLLVGSILGEEQVVQ